MRILTLPLYTAALMTAAFNGFCAAGFGRLHLFTHRVLHPATFGCCPVDHPVVVSEVAAPAGGTTGRFASKRGDEAFPPIS